MKKVSYKRNFSIDSINVFIGLCKGDKLLRPFSKEFNKFECIIAPIERQFNANKIDIINPDLILYSNLLEYTLIFEFTSASLEKKLKKTPSTQKTQLQKYADIEVDFIQQTIPLPAKSLKQYNVTFVLDETNYNEFIEHFKSLQYNFPVLVFDNKSDIFNIHLEFNSFSESQINSFFKESISFSKIPRLVKFDKQCFSSCPQEIFREVFNQILQILVKNKMDYIFSTKDIAAKVFCDELWNLYDIDYRKDVVNNINRFIDKLLRKFPLLSTKFFKKIGVSQYQIIIESKNKEFEITKIIRKVHEKISELHDKNENQQLELF